MNIEKLKCLIIWNGWSTFQTTKSPRAGYLCEQQHLCQAPVQMYMVAKNLQNLRVTLYLS
jgi:hypothetical protein